MKGLLFLLSLIIWAKSFGSFGKHFTKAFAQLDISCARSLNAASISIIDFTSRSKFVFKIKLINSIITNSNFPNYLSDGEQTCKCLFFFILKVKLGQQINHYRSFKFAVSIVTVVCWCFEYANFLDDGDFENKNTKHKKVSMLS